MLLPILPSPASRVIRTTRLTPIHTIAVSGIMFMLLRLATHVTRVNMCRLLAFTLVFGPILPAFLQAQDAPSLADAAKQIKDQTSKTAKHVDQKVQRIDDRDLFAVEHGDEDVVFINGGRRPGPPQLTTLTPKPPRHYIP